MKIWIKSLITASLVIAVAAGIAAAGESAALYEEAVKYWNMSDYQSATERFQRGMEFEGELSEKSVFAYALAQERLNDLQAAEEGFIRFINNYPDSEFIITARMKLANNLVEQGEFAQASYILYSIDPDSLSESNREVRLSLIVSCYLGLQQYYNVNNAIEDYLKRYAESAQAEQYRLWRAWYNLRESSENSEGELLRIIAESSDSKIIGQAKNYLLRLLIAENKEDTASDYMLELVLENKDLFGNTQMLWLARYLRENREFALAEDVLQMVLLSTNDKLVKAVALHEMALVETEDRRYHEALSKFPLIENELINSDGSIGEIELLRKIAEYSNVLVLRRIGGNARARLILKKLEPSISDQLYYQVLYEEGRVNLNIGKIEIAARQFMQVGILSDNPDLAGKALMECYSACKEMNNPKLVRLCLEELAGKNEGSYGKMYPNNPYTAQAIEILQTK